MTSRLQRARAALILTTILSPCIAVFAAHAADDGTQVAQAAPAASNANSIEIPEITITAQKRAESLSKAALSVSAFDGAAIEQQGLKSFADIARITPGLNLSVPSTGLGGDPQITIRGIIATAGAATTGIYIDDTPIALRPDLTSSNPFPKIFDLDRVEVLRGPQGVLFGAGSEGGTVRFITPQPSLTEYSGMGRAEGAFTDGGAPSYEVGAAVGGPLVENKVGFRMSAWHREDGGYINRVNPYSLNSADRNSNQELSDVLRVALKFQPTERLSITPSVYYQNTFKKDLEMYWEQTQAGVPVSKFVSAANFQQPRDDKFTLSSINANYEFDDFSVKLITSNFRRNAVSNIDATAYDLSQFLPIGSSSTGGVFLPTDPNYQTHALFTTGQNNWSTEFRLTSNTGPSDRLSWVFGGYYAHNHQTSINDYREPLDEVFSYLNSIGASYDGAGCASALACLGAPLNNNQSYFQDYQSNETELTGFANLGYKIIDDLKLELGVRYARSTFDFFNYQNGPDNKGPSYNSATRTETPVSPRVSLSYQIDPSTLIYTTAAKGYRIGGGNASLSGTSCAVSDLPALGIKDAPQTYSSDRVWSYEAGAKARMFHNSVELNGSVFVVDWSNIQSNVFLPVCGYNFTANLGKARSQGFDLQGQWRAGGGWVFEGNVGLTDARYTTTVYGGPNPVTGVRNILAKNGDSLPTPEWQGVASIEYNFDVSEYDSFVRAEYDFTGPYYRVGSAETQSFDHAIRAQSAVHYVTLRAGTTVDDLDVAAFVNNALNSSETLFRFHDTRPSPAFRDIAQRPLTIGLTSTYHF